MLTPAEFYGDSKTATLDGGDTHYLLPQERFQWLVPSGATGGLVTLQLPSAYKLIGGGPYWYVAFSGANRDVQLKDWAGGTVSIYDKNGDAQTSIDVSDTAKWGTNAGFLVFLANNTTEAGTWVAMFWATG